MISSQGNGTTSKQYGAGYDLNTMRDKAWQTAKGRNFERRAYMYQKLYREVMWPNQTPVSVVVPVYDKPEIIRKCLNAISEQTHKNIEIIVADDSTGANESLVYDFAKYVPFPVRYINVCKNVVEDIPGTLTKDYGLARARNEATIEATGEVMVYCDQRMIMEPNAIEEFLKRLATNKWLYGNKGGKKEFVENFSCVHRASIINAGLFSERMVWYGGLSQESRSRWRWQHNITEYVESAKAIPTGKSSNRNRKRADIIKAKNRLFKMDLA
jgi:glycosyltransferase involved in cell wall biosynthesis